MLCAVLLGGCAKPGPYAVTIGEGVDKVTAVVEGEKLEGIAEALDKAGIQFEVETLEQGSSAAEKAEAILSTAGKGATVAGTVTGNPIAAGAGLVLTSLAGLAGALGAFIRERKKSRKAATALSATLIAVDECEDVGYLITEAAEDVGLADYVEDTYRAAKGE